MSQRTGGIQVPNQLRATFRADINSALLALVTHNSGGSAPDTTYDSMFWPDTANGLLKMRDTGNANWITIGALNTTNLGLATLASPQLTGVPTTPTALAATNTTQIASTAFVQSAIANVGAWNNATLLNSYSNAGGAYANARYRLFPAGIVELQGLITKTTTPTGGETILTLPTGYRPAAKIRLVQYYTSNTGGVASAHYYEIDTSGNLIINFGSTPAASSAYFFTLNLLFGIN